MKRGSNRWNRRISRAEKNARDSRHELAMLLNNNFTAGVDYHMGLDYSPAGLDDLIMRAGTDARDAIKDAACREIKNYILRLRRECKSRGVPLRYVHITSDMDGKTGIPARIHHHIVINAEAADIAAAKWTKGRTFTRKLRGEPMGDLTGLAEYLIAQTRTIPGQTRYSPSRSLEKPKITYTRESSNPDAEIQTPKGCKLIYRAESEPGRTQLIRYYRPPDGAEAAGKESATLRILGGKTKENQRLSRARACAKSGF